jgi:hypothetical protein
MAESFLIGQHAKAQLPRGADMGRFVRRVTIGVCVLALHLLAGYALQASGSVPRKEIFSKVIWLQGDLKGQSAAMEWVGATPSPYRRTPSVQTGESTGDSSQLSKSVSTTVGTTDPYEPLQILAPPEAPLAAFVPLPSLPTWNSSTAAPTPCGTDDARAIDPVQHPDEKCVTP